MFELYLFLLFGLLLAPALGIKIPSDNVAKLGNVLLGRVPEKGVSELVNYSIH